MKKIILLAAFGVAGLVSAKGTIENKVEIKFEKIEVGSAFQLCGVTVTFYNSLGEITGQQLYTSDQPNLDSCLTYQSGVIADLRAQGYRVEMSGDVN